MVSDVTLKTPIVVTILSGMSGIVTGSAMADNGQTPTLEEAISITEAGLTMFKDELAKRTSPVETTEPITE